MVKNADKHIVFFLTSELENNPVLDLLENKYELHTFNSVENITTQLKEKVPSIIVLNTNSHSILNDIIENNLGHIHQIWFPNKIAITDTELLSCYEKGIEHVAPRENRDYLLMAKIKSVLKLQELKEHYIKKKLLVREPNVVLKNKEAELMDKIFDYLAANCLKKEFCIEKMSNDLAMSRTSFFSKVKAITGVSPSKMVMNYRLTNAALLLKENHGNIAEIAYKVGFSSTAYFTKCFKEKYGQKPSQIKADIANQLDESPAVPQLELEGEIS